MKNEILLKLYEMNENYHSVKEKSIWLACAIYLTVSAAVIKWIVDSKADWLKMIWIPLSKGSPALYIVILVAVLYLTIFLYIVFQNKKKCESVVKTGNFNKLIKSLDIGDKVTYEDIIEKTRYSETKLSSIKCFFILGYPAVLILLLITVIFVAQLLLMLV